MKILTLHNKKSTIIEIKHSRKKKSLIKILTLIFSKRQIYLTINRRTYTIIKFTKVIKKQNK